MVGCPNLRNACPSRALAGRKLASGFFGRCRPTRVRKTLRKSLNSRRVARSCATKTASGVRYYGRRYHSPAIGRFVNRDPIEESGGLNLYAFCGNDAGNRFDVLGTNIFTDAFRFLEHLIFGNGSDKDQSDKNSSDKSKQGEAKQQGDATKQGDANHQNGSLQDNKDARDENSACPRSVNKTSRHNRRTSPGEEDPPRPEEDLFSVNLGRKSSGRVPGLQTAAFARLSVRH
jgi:RHS repeat-associated protein